MVMNLLKVTHVLEGLQQAEPLRMLNMFGLQSTKTGDCGSTALIWKQRPSWPNGSCLVLQPKEGTANLLQDQDHVHRVFRLGMCCQSCVQPSRPNS